MKIASIFRNSSAFLRPLLRCAWSRLRAHLHWPNGLQNWGTFKTLFPIFTNTFCSITLRTACRRSIWTTMSVPFATIDFALIRLCCRLGRMKIRMRRLTGWILLFNKFVFITFQAILRAYIPRILHPWLGCRRQTADLSLLQGKGRLKTNVQESVC